MEMRFQFEQTKAIQVMAYLVGRLTSIEKVKLMKLVYLADKAHFLRCGYPITGDRLCALPHGPIPSSTLDVLNGNIWPEPEAAYEFLHLDDNTVMLRSDPGHTLLNADERATLDAICTQYGPLATWKVVDATHDLPEYIEAYATATARGVKSAVIPYEMILKHSGDEAHYRQDRPVVSSDSVSHMLCPLNGGEDADL